MRAGCIEVGEVIRFLQTLAIRRHLAYRRVVDSMAEKGNPEGEYMLIGASPLTQ